jgi:hypothetical protein
MTAKSPRDRWWDYSCRMWLYSEMAVRGHHDCRTLRALKWGGLTAPSRRVPEVRKGAVGAVGIWRRNRRRAGLAEGWS